MSLTTSPIFSAPVESSCTVALVRSASLTARLATSVERVTWREISATELDNSSAAAATVPTLPEAVCEPADLDGIVLEDLDRRGHRADLIAAADAGDAAVEPAVGELLHAGAEQGERSADAAAEQPGNAAGDDGDAEHGKAEQPIDRAH